MIEVTVIGIASSIATELVTWLNSKFSGTVLQGRAAFFLSLVVALVGAVIKLLFIDHVEVANYQDLFALVAQAWMISQVWFVVVATKLGLEVK